MTRQEYLDGKIDHQTYYCALVDAIGRKPIEGIVKGIVRQSMYDPTQDWHDRLTRALNADEHLNNIPLKLWDSRHEIIMDLIRHGKGREVMTITYPGTQYTGKFSWSLSDTVCTLKAAAKRLALEGK